ncbi:thiosulfate reductase [Leminorella grimontii]|uniref:Thiosulfate reductase n=1 Tax=Leminorella grimontii TaxID=82981 RepID=A0AAV5N0Q7_9GAMM|nr:thiosulfate reductase PhsA [Leminorella grimontii]KFC96551.1 thiosulfate reductase [Leminorella grimontii ATCC 33999 = DSM 5078]GKX54252.1 thiosulfate reductase [Leminorella grimontii]VFS59671.1 Sulfur reductase chain A [Leminorella grimontii]
MSINRRDFIKSVGVGCAGYAIGSFAPGALALQKPEMLDGKSSLTPSLCEMCSFRCPIEAQVINNKTVFIQGNTHAEHQGSRVCARGGSGVSLINDPARIVQPMKRKGPRGAGEWEVITWEQAYKEIAEKLNAIKKAFGPESVVFSSKSGSLSSHLFHLASAFGSPNTFTHATTCPAGKAIAAQVMMGGDLAMDIENTRYMVAFGHNLYEGIEVADTHEMMMAQENGAKVVSFDPRLSVFSSKADEWHAIRPGGDLPVLQAMCHVLIEENLYDKAFIERYTVGFDRLSASLKDTTPEWAEKHSDISADVIRRVAREIAAAAPHVIVNPGHRATYNKEELDMRRMIFTMNALLGCIERRGGMYQKKGAEKYNKLAGEAVAPTLAKPGVKDMPKIEAKRIDATRPEFKYINKGGGIVQSIIDAVETEKPYAVKAWMMSRHNPLQTVSCRPELVKTIEKLELVVSCDVYLSESAAYADYLLPECTYLERDEEISDVSGLNPAYAVRQQVVKPIGNAKPSWQIWQELGSALGLEKYFPWKDMATRQLFQAKGDEDLYKKIHQTGYLSYGIPLLLREPDSVSAFVKAYPKAAAGLSADGTFGDELKFKSPSGLIELYSETLEGLAEGFGAPLYRQFPLKEDGELYFIQGKVAVHTNGATQYVPMLSELMWDNPVWIHPQTAKEKGIKTGDVVWLSNKIGKEKGTALVTPAIRPDTLFVYMGFGAKAGAKTAATTHGVHCGNLLPHETSPVCGTNVHTAGVQLSRG